MTDTLRNLFAMASIPLLVLTLSACSGKSNDTQKKPEQPAASQPAQEQQAQESQPDQQIQIAGDIKAEEIAAAYEKNEKAADQKYKGKYFRITGTVDELDKDAKNRPQIHLKWRDPFNRPQLIFSKDLASEVAKYKKGQKVAAICKFNGIVFCMAQGVDCQFDAAK